MKPRSSYLTRPASFVATLTFAFAAIQAHATTYYWDNAAAGFGTAGGTWTAPTLNQWSTDSTGAAAPGASITTGTGDDLNFGTSALGLASGSISVGTVSARNITFGSLSGAITLTGGSIALSGNIGASATPAATHTIASDIVLSGNRKIGSLSGEKYILTGNISGSGSSLEIDPGNSTGSVTLNGNNSFSGDVQISRGQLKVNTVSDKLANSALGAGSKISMGLGGLQGPILWYSGSSAASTNRDFELNSTASGVIFSQDAPLTLSGTFKNIAPSATATLVLTGDAGGGANLNEVSGAVQDNGTSLMAVQLAVATPVGGTSAEHGFWKLSGNNSYSGATSVANASTLVIAHSNALGNTTGGTSVTQGSQLLLTGNIAVGAEALTLNSAQFASWNSQNGAALRNYSGNNSFAGAITLGQATTIATNSMSTLTLTGGITGAQNLTFNSVGDTTVSTAAIATGVGTLTKTGAGKLTVSSNNTYTGQTTISTGTLQLGAGGTTGKLSASSAIVNNANLTINRSDAVTQGTDFSSAAISGTGSLTAAGTGTTTLNAANSYSGGTSVNAGADLRINGAQTGVGTVTVAATGKLGGSGSVIGGINVSGILAPGNSIESLGGGALSFVTGSTYAYELNTQAFNGDLTYSSGTLNIASGTILTLTDLFTSTVLANDSKLTLISSVGAWNGGLFSYNAGAGLATLADDSNFTFGLNTWKINYNDTVAGSNFSSDTTGATNFVTLTVVPEPDVAALLGGLGALALLRRRR